MLNDPNLGALLLDICRPDGPNARLAVLLASIENARDRLLRGARMGLETERIAGMALEEFGKVFDAKAAYDRVALGQA